jgi:hypothetical protein
MKLHDDATRAQLIARLDALSPAAAGQWGRMKADQMLFHLGAGLATAIGELQCESKVTPMLRYMVRWIALYGPWPKEAPTAKEFLAEGAYDFEVERVRVKQLMLKLAARPIQGRWPAHPAFGPLSGRQWSLLQYRHVDHHLRQFGV